MKKLFSEYQLGPISLKNRIVMAPMTRSRCSGNIPGDLVATYYTQRSEAGLIITEGTSPSLHGLGYPRIPGAFTEAQRAGWKNVADAVHRAGSKLFVQLMHTGRVGHPLNLPEGGRVLAPSPIGMSGEMYTDAEGPKPYPIPTQMTEDDILQAIEDFASAAAGLMEQANCDGVELHGANGYLIDQFLNTASNQRTDKWGGSVENRARFALDVTRAAAQRIGASRTGIRLSPYGVFNDMAPDSEMDDLYMYLTAELAKLNITYIHIVDHSSMGAPAPDRSLVDRMRSMFPNTFILSGGYTAERAEEDLQQNKSDLISFGRPFISNPQLPTALKQQTELSQPNFDLLYTPGPKGYTDYPLISAAN